MDQLATRYGRCVLCPGTDRWQAPASPGGQEPPPKRVGLSCGCFSKFLEASKVDASFDKRPLAIKDAIPAESGATARKVAIKAQSRKVTHPLLGSPTVALT